MAGGLARVEQILQQQAFWAARPDTLNDPEEFRWSCDYAPTQRTVALLANVLHRIRGLTAVEALQAAHTAIEGHGLAAIAEPILSLLQQRCRDEVGLVCFGTSDCNPVLWQRYGGNGAGVCIEVDVADSLVGSQLHRVGYAAEKRVHVDEVLAASLGEPSRTAVYTMALLTKPLAWQQEEEVRFVSSRQGVSIRLDSSPITALVVGRTLPEDIQAALEASVAKLQYPVAVRSEA